MIWRWTKGDTSRANKSTFPRLSSIQGRETECRTRASSRSLRDNFGQKIEIFKICLPHVLIISKMAHTDQVPAIKAVKSWYLGFFGSSPLKYDFNGSPIGLSELIPSRDVSNSTPLLQFGTC